MNNKIILPPDTFKLKKIYLFSELNEADLEALLSICHFKNYDKGEIIFFDTEPYRGFYCVMRGKVRIYKVAQDGREHTLHFIEEKNSFAEVPMFENQDEEQTYPANALALEDRTQLIFISQKAFYQMFSQNIAIYKKMIAALSKRLRHLNNHIEGLTLQDVSKRLANFIVTEAKNAGCLNEGSKISPVKIDFSRTDIASYLGIAVETLSRTLGKFQDQNIISIKGRSITIKDLHALTMISEK